MKVYFFIIICITMYLLYCFFGNVLALAKKTENFRNKVTLSKKPLQNKA